MNRSIATLVFLLLATSTAFAHPGWGLVQDIERGLIYYSDLERVWRIDSLGQRTVAVPDVHTHELMLDEAGHLYGEDSEYLGEDRFRYRVWRLDLEGQLIDLIPWRWGFRDDYGFVRDIAGTLYWPSCVGREQTCVVKRRTSDGYVEVAARGAEFDRPLNYLVADPRGGVLLADGSDLKRITPSGEVEFIARNLARTGGRFALMGLYVAADGSIYAAAFADGVVVRLAPDGNRHVVAQSDEPWQPAGVIATEDGLWILEFNQAQVQLRHLPSRGGERIYGEAG